MAERRMFAKTIIDSDAFIDMPLSTQALYFHLSIRADDDGFVNNPKKVQRMISCNDDDLKLLIAKNFILVFDTGVIVIKHWKIHNYIQADRYKETIYTEEKKQLKLEDNGMYTKCVQDVYTLDTQVRSGKVRLGKASKEEERKEEERKEEKRKEEKRKEEKRIGEERSGEPEIFKKIGLYTNEILSAEAQLKLDTFQQFIRELIKANQFEILSKITINILEKSYSKCKNKPNIMNYLKVYVVHELSLSSEI